MQKNKQKSFIQEFKWVGILLLIMGIIFFTVGMVIQFIPMGTDDLSVYSNGVRQVTTEKDVMWFRLIFLLTFGLVGLILGITGGITLSRNTKKKKQRLILKEKGVRVMADVVEYAASNVKVNNNPLGYIRCSYDDLDGKTYIFKSEKLRMNPLPYINNEQVTVYYDRENMSNYFVDIDGSTELGSRVVEL